MRSQIAFARGAPGGLVRIRMPSAVNTVSNAWVNRQSRSRSRNVTRVERSAMSISRFRAAWVVHAPGRVRGHPGQMCPATTVLDRDQRGDPPEKHGVHRHEIHGQDGLRLRGEELAPGRTRPARCGVDTSVMQDLPHGAGGDAMAEPDQLALHPPMSPGGILGCHANHQSCDRCCGRGTPGSATRRVVPSPRDQLAVPSQDRGRSDREDLGPAATWHEPGQRGQPCPVDGPVANPGDLSVQHGVLVP
jgi:hypothetical protein